MFKNSTTKKRKKEKQCNENTLNTKMRQIYKKINVIYSTQSSINY